MAISGCLSLWRNVVLISKISSISILGLGRQRVGKLGQSNTNITVHQYWILLLKLTKWSSGTCSIKQRELKGCIRLLDSFLMLFHHLGKHRKCRLPCCIRVGREKPLQNVKILGHVRAFSGTHLMATSLQSRKVMHCNKLSMKELITASPGTPCWRS